MLVHSSGVYPVLKCFLYDEIWVFDLKRGDLAVTCGILTRDECIYQEACNVLMIGSLRGYYSRV